MAESSADMAQPADTLQEASNFKELAIEMRERKLPLLLVFRAEYCGFCRRLEQEHLIPMQRGGDYAERILIRQFSVDKTENTIDFQGNTVSSQAFAETYKATITPTVTFLDADGKQVAEPLVGYNSPDYYGAYLENAIQQAGQAVRGGDQTTPKP